jgi:uncharacterized protein YbjT (DUF2867 family)
MTLRISPAWVRGETKKTTIDAQTLKGGPVTGSSIAGRQWAKRCRDRNPGKPAAFAKPDRFIGKAIEIAGDELTNPDIAATFGRVMGRPAGFQADIPSLRRDYPEIALTSLEGWLTREGWANKKSYVRHAKTFDARIPKAATMERIR